jgi:hypothetical protein
MAFWDDLAARVRDPQRQYALEAGGYTDPTVRYDETIGYNSGALKGRTMVAMNRENATAQQLQDEYIRRALSFDPTKAVGDTARGAWSSIVGDVGGLKDMLRDLKGQSVGSGRLDTGFFDEDQGAVVNRAVENLNANIAQGSLQATSMAQRNIEDIGSYASQSRARYLDLLTGGLNQQIAQQEAAAARKAGLWGDIIGGAAKVGAALAL